MSAKRPQYRLGVDVGGTHTDLVLLDSTTGQLLVEKVAIACASATHQSLIGIVGGFYPTVIRGNGVGYATGMGRFGAILGPVIAGYLLSRFPLHYALFFIAAPDLVVAAACIALDRCARGDSPANASPPSLAADASQGLR